MKIHLVVLCDFIFSLTSEHSFGADTKFYAYLVGVNYLDRSASIILAGSGVVI